MLMERTSFTDFLLALRNLSASERQYLYDHIGISSEQDLVVLLQAHNKPFNSSLQTALDELPEQFARRSLLLYVPPVLIILGTLGNLLSFAVLRCRAMVKVSSYHYLAFLALADTLVLYVGLLRIWLEELVGWDLQDGVEWACKAMVALGYVASDLSVWLIIAVTAERYIVVRFPLRATTLISTRRAKKIIALLALLMLLLNLHFLWTVGLVPAAESSSSSQSHYGNNHSTSNCQATPRHERLVDEVWPWVDAFVYSFLPFVVILSFNSCITLHVLRARRHRQGLQSMAGSGENRNSLQVPSHHRHLHSKRQRHLHSYSTPVYLLSRENHHLIQHDSDSDDSSRGEESMVRAEVGGEGDADGAIASPPAGIKGRGRVKRAPETAAGERVGKQETRRGENRGIGIKSRGNGGESVMGGRREGVGRAERGGAGDGTKLTVMLLIVSFTFLLTTLPMNAMLIATAFWNQRIDHDLHSTARFHLAKTVAELLMYVNHSANFGLYCAGGHKFRQQVRQLLCCTRKATRASWSSVATEHSRLSGAEIPLRHWRPSRRHLMVYTADDLDCAADKVVCTKTQV